MRYKLIYFCLLLIGFVVLQSKEKNNDGVWLHDLEQAKELSKKDKKKILLVFSGSDWCIACIKLNRLVLEKKEFLEVVQKDHVLLNIDFPSKKENALPPEHQKKNDDISEKYNPKGFFPLVVVLNSEGDVLHSVEKFQGE